MSNFLLQIFSFEGRLSRGRYWLLVISVLIAISLSIFFIEKYLRGLPPFVEWVVTAFFLVTPLWAVISLQTKRLHDRGVSAWWLFASLVLLGVATLLRGSGNQGSWVIFTVLAIPLNLYLIYESCCRGDAGDNNYGPDPLLRLSSQPSKIHELTPKRSYESSVAAVTEVDWALAADEFSNERNTGLWAQCFSEFNGDEKRAEAQYLRARAHAHAEKRVRASSEFA